MAKALWVLFFFMFCRPFIGAADSTGEVAGIPGVLLYIFIAWAMLVAALAVVAGRMED